MALIAKSVNTKTAFVSLAALIVIMSFLMAINAVSFGGGVGMTVIASLIILALDEAGILA